MRICGPSRPRVLSLGEKKSIRSRENVKMTVKLITILMNVVLNWRVGARGGVRIIRPD